MLNKTLKAIVSCLNNHSIPYMVIGGYAVLYHGEARLTEDIDIVLGRDNEELSNVLEAVTEEFSPRIEDVEKFVIETNVLPLASKVNQAHVDLIFSFINFEREAIERAVSADIDGMIIKIAAEDLIIYKLLASRPRDLEDVKNILNLNTENIDKETIDKNILSLSELLGNSELTETWNSLKNTT